MNLKNQKVAPELEEKNPTYWSSQPKWKGGIFEENNRITLFIWKSQILFRSSYCAQFDFRPKRPWILEAGVLGVGLAKMSPGQSLRAYVKSNGWKNLVIEDQVKSYPVFKILLSPSVRRRGAYCLSSTKIQALNKMRLGFTALALLLYTILTSFRPSASQPGEYFNIARGKKITATATCGYDLPPPGPETELFCKLATVPGKFGIRGLECDHCDPKVTSGKSVKDTKDHRIEYAIDGTERWWQSPPLSRGQQYNKINITIDLGQVRKCLLMEVFSRGLFCWFVDFLRIYFVTIWPCGRNYFWNVRAQRRQLDQSCCALRISPYYTFSFTGWKNKRLWLRGSAWMRFEISS